MCILLQTVRRVFRISDAILFLRCVQTTESVGERCGEPTSFDSTERLCLLEDVADGHERRALQGDSRVRRDLVERPVGRRSAGERKGRPGSTGSLCPSRRLGEPRRLQSVARAGRTTRSADRRIRSDGYPYCRKEGLSGAMEYSHIPV